MRIVFMGTPDFAAPTLAEIVRLSHDLGQRRRREIGRAHEDDTHRDPW